MPHPGGPFRFLVLFAYLGVTAFSAVGPRVLCLWAGGGFEVMEKLQSGGCAGALRPTGPCAVHAVPTTENTRSAVCEDCFDIQLPGLGEQVLARGRAVDVDLHPLFCPLQGAHVLIIAAHAVADRLAHYPPPRADHDQFLLTTIQLC